MRLHRIGEDIASPNPWNLVIKAENFSHASAKYDHIGVDDIDHLCEALSKTMDVSP